MDKNNSPAAAGTAADTGIETASEPAKRSATVGAKQAPKWLRVLGGFLERGPLGWNRFEAARELRDHVLPTTVSQLEDRGVQIMRREEILPGAFGPVRCARYWLAPGSINKARELLGLRRAAP